MILCTLFCSVLKHNRAFSFNVYVLLVNVTWSCQVRCQNSFAYSRVFSNDMEFCVLCDLWMCICIYPCLCDLFHEDYFTERIKTKVCNLLRHFANKVFSPYVISSKNNNKNKSDRPISIKDAFDVKDVWVLVLIESITVA